MMSTLCLCDILSMLPLQKKTFSNMIYLSFFVLSAKKLDCTPRKKLRDTMAGGGCQILPCSGTSQEPSARRRPISTNPDEHGGIMAGGGNPNYGFRRRDTMTRPLPGLSQESLTPSVQT